VHDGVLFAMGGYWIVCGGKDLWNWWVLSLVWMSEGAMDGEPDEDKGNELTCVKSMNVTTIDC